MTDHASFRLSKETKSKIRVAKLLMQAEALEEMYYDDVLSTLADNYIRESSAGAAYE